MFSQLPDVNQKKKKKCGRLYIRKQFVWHLRIAIWMTEIQVELNE